MQIIQVDFGNEDDELDATIDNHPVGKAVPDTTRALLDAHKWSVRIGIARDAYAEALEKCRRLGLTNVEIAHVVGKTEAAIRAHFKRRGL